MSNKSKSIIEIIKTTNDIELLHHIGKSLPHLQEVIYKKIIVLGKKMNKV